eukprot:TRINITY_DN955_c0_g1_i1.p1 TRINITY_DN955_c0_g1~~TRINITY_DN955_c0_g1_i1.p1  ORF type:complete len:579 (+),score=58.12 TRINITY_DN955_c0_g1_i1:169-1905(+)
MFLIVIMEALIVAIITVLVYQRFASWTAVPWYVHLFVVYGWFSAFVIVCLTPIDVASAWYDDCNKHNINRTRGSMESCGNQPASYLAEEPTLAIWRILYWSMYILCWTVYPVLQSYSLAGGFTVFAKFKAAIIENVIIYGVMGTVFLILLIWLVAKADFDQNSLMLIAIAFANSWGLLLVISLMGHGIVEIPRRLWRESNRYTMMKYYYFQIVSYYDELQSSEEKFEKTLKFVKKIDETVRDNDPWRPYVDQIVETSMPEYALVRYAEGSKDITYKNLVKLSARVVRTKYLYHRSKCLYENLLDRALALEDTIEEVRNPSPDKVMHWSFASKQRTGRFRNFLNRIEWIWKIWLEVSAYRFAALICAGLSITLLWSEVTFSSKDGDTTNGGTETGGIDLSIWSQLIHAKHLSDLFRQFFVFVAVAYLSACVYWSLFNFRIFDLYALLPHGQTDASSLLFAALYLGRLTAPLVYNFLNMIHNSRTAFYVLMGDMSKVPVLGASFNTYLPLALGIIVLATAFNLYSRIATVLHLRRFHFDTNWNDAQIDEGADLLRRERVEREKKGDIDSSPLQGLTSDRL